MITKKSNLYDRHDEPEQPKQPIYQLLLFIGAVAFFGIIFYAIQRTNFTPSAGFEAGVDNTRAIGEQLYTKHVIPFELVSVLLTVAFIGAIVIAKKEEE